MTDNKKAFWFAVSGQITVYVIQYLILPFFIHISAYDPLRNKLAIVISAACISAIWMAFIRTRFSGWIAGIVPYTILATFFNPHDYYGIGVGVFDIGVITIAIYSFFVIVTELVVWVVINLIRKYMKRKHMTDTEQ